MKAFLLLYFAKPVNIFYVMRELNRLIAIAILSLLTLLAWGSVLSLPHTDVDTWPLILTSRFHAPHEAISLFSQELLNGRMINAQYYRPLLTLTYGLNEYLFGLRPFSYHAVDLFIHLVNVMLLYGLGRKMAPTSWRGFAFFAALLFALHPLHVENIPAIARRADLLCGFFVLASLLAFLEHFRIRPFLWLSLGLYLLGLFSKESAIVIPMVLLAAHIHLRPRAANRDFFRLTIQTFLPFFLLTVLYFALRFAVLKGLGGYAHPPRLGVTLASNLIGHPLGLLLGGLHPIWPCVARPFLSWEVSALLFFGGTVGLLVLGMLGLIIQSGREAFRKLASLEENRLLYFLAEFLLIHILLTFVFGFNFRYLYAEIAAFSLLLSAVGSLLPPLWENLRGPETGRRLRGLLVLVAYTVTVGNLLIGSPLFFRKPIDRWREDGLLAQENLQKLEALVGTEPTETTFFLVNFPYQRVDLPSLQFVTVPLSVILMEHAIQAYVDLRLPEKRATIVGLSYAVLAGELEDTPFVSDTAFLAPNQISVHVLQGGRPTINPWKEVFGPRHWGEMYEGKRSEDRQQVLINLKPQAQHLKHSVFLVSDGESNVDLIREPFQQNQRP